MPCLRPWEPSEGEEKVEHLTGNYKNRDTSLFNDLQAKVNIMEEIEGETQQELNATCHRSSTKPSNENCDEKSSSPKSYFILEVVRIWVIKRSLTFCLVQRRYAHEFFQKFKNC